MFPENESLEQVFLGILDYVGGRWYAMIVFVLLFIWARKLYKEFHWRTLKYSHNTPNEVMLLNLQCRRWEMCVHQVLIGIGISVAIAFIMYLFVEMGKDIISVAQIEGENTIPKLNIAYLETLVFVFIFSIKFRALWDAKGVHNDLKESNL
jgi:hypothetical protein